MESEIVADPAMETVTSVVSEPAEVIPTQAPPVVDWLAERTAIANGDPKILNRLGRYTTRDDAIRAGVEAQNKIGSIRATQPINADSSPEDIAAFRQANGVPESADKYQINLSDGLIIGENDRPVVDHFLGIAHKHNLSNAVTSDIISGQLALQETMIEQRAASDRESLTQARAVLSSNDVWGSETNLNINLIHGLLDGAPEGVKDQLVNGRMQDGTPIFNHAPTLQWLASIAREANPVATVVPGSGANGMMSIDNEIKSIEDARRTNPDSYWKSQPTQDRLTALLGAKSLAEAKYR
jgi:hypothetical protein